MSDAKTRLDIATEEPDSHAAPLAAQEGGNPVAMKRGAVIGVVGILAACTLATANEEPKKANMIEQRQAERRQASAEAAKERVLATFYGRVFAAGAESFAGAVFAGHVDLLAAELARQAAERQAAAFTPPARSGGGAVNSGGGGDCYSRKPAGFPDYVIDRESGGDPNATNGAHDGCAQIADSHFNGGACSGMSYDACWARLWNGGAGASNWAQTL